MKYKNKLFKTQLFLLPLIIWANLANSQIKISDGTTVDIPAATYMISGTDFTIENGGDLDLRGFATINGNLTNSSGTSAFIIESDASGTGSLIVNGSVSGNLTMQRYIAAATWETGDDGWHILSSPVRAQTIAPNFTDDPYDFYCWHESTNNWVNYKNTTTAPTWANANIISNGLTENTTDFNVGKGYMAAYGNASTKNFAGEIIVNDVSISGLVITGTIGYNSWHLLGNPFTSALIWDASWTKSNINGTVQIWNEDGKSYTAITAGGVIPANNGFMVQAQGGTGSITIPENKRVHSAQAFFKNSGFPLIKLKAQNLDNPSYQESQILFNPESSNAYEMQFDCDFLPGYAPRFYSTCYERELCVNSLPEYYENLKIPFTFIKNAGANFSIEMFEEAGMSMDVWLLDKKNGNKQNLSQNSRYVFTSVEGDEEERFEIHFGSVDINETDPTPETFSWFSQGLLFISMEEEITLVDIIDITGRTLQSTQLKGEGTQNIAVEYPTGVYFVRLTAKGVSKTEKIIIN